MKRLALLFLSLTAVACSSGGSNLRSDASLPAFLPGIPKSITQHCLDTSQAAMDGAPEVDGFDFERKQCTQLKLYERCLARMEKVAERESKRPGMPSKFFDRFPGGWDHGAAGDSLSDLTELPACDGVQVNLQAMQAATAIAGRLTADWEKLDPRTPTTCN